MAFAFFINWALMALAFATWLVVPLRFGRSYYRVHAFERSGRLYERLGVRRFQRLLRHVGLMNPWLTYRPSPSTRTSLIAATEGSETAHLLIFGILAVVSAVFVQRGWWDTAGWLLFFNIVLNAYPVLSLRAVRARAERLFGPQLQKDEPSGSRGSRIVGWAPAAHQAAAADERRVVQAISGTSSGPGRHPDHEGT